MADIEDAGSKCTTAPVAKKTVAVKLPATTTEDVSGFKDAYDAHVKERAKQGPPAWPLDPKQAQCLMELLQKPPADLGDFLVDLLSNRLSPSVDDAAYVKANFLNDIVKGATSSPLVSKAKALELLEHLPSSTCTRIR